MTDDDVMTDDADRDGVDSSDRPQWADDAEDALGRVRESLKAAWDASRDARLGALDAARTAATQLGAAIDRGADAARTRWDDGGAGGGAAAGGEASATAAAPDAAATGAAATDEEATPEEGTHEEDGAPDIF